MFFSPILRSDSASNRYFLKCYRMLKGSTGFKTLLLNANLELIAAFILGIPQFPLKWRAVSGFLFHWYPLPSSQQCLGEHRVQRQWWTLLLNGQMNSADGSQNKRKQITNTWGKVHNTPSHQQLKLKMQLKPTLRSHLTLVRKWTKTMLAKMLGKK